MHSPNWDSSALPWTEELFLISHSNHHKGTSAWLLHQGSQTDSHVFSSTISLYQLFIFLYSNFQSGQPDRLSISGFPLFDFDSLPSKSCSDTIKKQDLIFRNCSSKWHLVCRWLSSLYVAVCNKVGLSQLFRYSIITEELPCSSPIISDPWLLSLRSDSKAACSW